MLRRLVLAGRNPENRLPAAPRYSGVEAGRDHPCAGPPPGSPFVSPSRVNTADTGD